MAYSVTDVLFLIQYPLQFDDQDCVLAERTGIGGLLFLYSSLMDMQQQVTGDRMETGHRKLDYIISTDDEEVTLPPHNRNMEVCLTFRIQISVIDKLCRTHNEKTGYFRWNPFTGLAQDRPAGSALR